MMAENQHISDQHFRPAHKVFYGWYIVAATFSIMAVSCGLGFYNLSVFLKAFVSHSGFSVETVSAATACFSISTGLTGMVVAWTIDRFDPRWVISAGAIILSVAIAGAGQVTSLWQLFLFYVIFGMGYASTALVPCTTLVARWFSRRRGQALAIASTGLSFGGIIFTPLAASLIETIDFGPATLWLALFPVVFIIPIATLVLRPTPHSMGLTPDGEAPLRAADGSLLLPDGFYFREAVRSRYFILFTIMYTFIFIAQIGSLAHQFRLVAERTANDHVAGTAVGAMAAFSIVGRLLSGFLLSRISTRNYLLLMLTIQGVSYVLFAETHSAYGLIFCSALLGMTVGNIQVMMPLMLAEAFGVISYARIFSSVQMVTTCIQSTGPLLVGVLYTRAGGYEAAYLALLGFTGIAIALALMLGPMPMAKRAAATSS